MRAPRRLGVCMAGALGACATEPYLIVTVDAVPAVHDARSLAVSLTNAGTTRVDSLALGDHAFPVTFSISAPERSGELAISIDALDGMGLVVGQGGATTTVEAPSTRVHLDATDFVVNTEFANDQFPSDDFEAAGFQLAALPDGTWTAAFRDSCMAGSCNIFARRFDEVGRPVASAVAANSNAFRLSTVATTSQSTPALAAGTQTTLALWDRYDVMSTAHSIACRPLDSSGRAPASETAIGTDGADVVSVAALASGNFVAAWNAAPVTDQVIRTVFLRPDCSAVTAVQSVSILAGIAHRASVASSGDRVLYAWIVDGDVHARLATLDGNYTTVDLVLVGKTATDQVAHARVAAATGGGFVLAARWSQLSGTGPGRIELFRVSPTGMLGAPALVTDRSGSDSDNRESFALASRPDGTLLVAWHTCGPLGDDNQCGVFGRFLRDTGAPLGDSFTIPTTTAGDQKRPSVVALPDAFVAIWADASQHAPDVLGLGVRARILYPPAL